MFRPLAIASGFVFIGCQPTNIEYINESLPVFDLVDVNTTSVSFETSISSGQFAPELISAWYFGHST